MKHDEMVLEIKRTRVRTSVRAGSFVKAGSCLLNTQQAPNTDQCATNSCGGSPPPIG